MHAVKLMDITLTWQTGTWRERCSKQGAGILIWEKLRTSEITSSVPVGGFCMTTTMSTAGRFTEIRHTSKDPLPFAAERQMAKSKRRTTAKGVTWCVSAKESNVIDLVGPVSWVSSVNQEVHRADKGKTDNAGQPPWHPELDVSKPRTAATWAFQDQTRRHCCGARPQAFQRLAPTSPSASLPIAQALVPCCLTPRLASSTTSLVLLNS